MEALILQQVWYGVLWRVPAMARLLISVCLTALVLWWFPLRQIDAVAMPLLIVLAAALFLTAYAFGGGVPDHPMDYYIAALSASPARRLATDLFNRDVARRTDEFLWSRKWSSRATIRKPPRNFGRRWTGLRRARERSKPPPSI